MSPLALPAVAIAAGFVSASSPCVLPVIPGYLAAVSTTSGVNSDEWRPSRRGAVAFVAGFTVVFTLLGATATLQDVDRLCDEARTHHFAAVCVLPFAVPAAVEALRGCDVKVATVVSYPLGADATRAKIAAAESSIAAGADELGVVLTFQRCCRAISGSSGTSSWRSCAPCGRSGRTRCSRTCCATCARIGSAISRSR